MLKVTELNYRKEKKDILTNINLEIGPQRIIGLLGPNGSGKTTIMQMLAGFISNQNGNIVMDGDSKRETLLENIVYMNNEFHLPKTWRVKEVLQFHRNSTERFDYQTSMGMIKFLNLDLEAKMEELSRGEKERVLLIVTLSQRAKYYFLDEPLTGIDMLTREDIIKSLLAFAQEEATIVIASHYIEVFEMLLDEVYFVKQGRILGHVDCEKMREEKAISLSEYYREMYSSEVEVW